MALFASKPLGESCGDPGRGTDPSIHLLHDGSNTRHNLNSTAATSQDGDLLSREVYLFVVLRTVLQYAFE